MNIMKKNTSSIIIFIFLLCVGLIQVSAQEFSHVTFSEDSVETKQFTITDADSAFILADYHTAIMIYESILATRGVSATLYMNLGNAYYKTDNISKAILNYERAYLLNPSDHNIRFNLELARTKTVDRIVQKNELFITVWIKKLIASLNINQWAWLTIFLFIITLAFVGIFLFSRKIFIRKLSFVFGCFFFVSSIISYIFATTQKSSLEYCDFAIIMAPGVAVRSTPSESGTELYIIHEGRKVRILDDSMKEWVEVELDDSNVGWIPVSVMERI